jgi:hypothetical protein
MRSGDGAVDGKGNPERRNGPRGRIEDAVAAWPTPSAAVMNDGESLESWAARRDRNAARHVNGNGVGTPLTIAAQAWPTPAARDTRSGEAGAATLAANARPLNEVASHWPTPNVPNGGRVAKEIGPTGRTPKGKRQVNLRQYVTDFFPSPPPAPPTAPPGPASSPSGPTSPPLWPTPVQEDSQVTGWRPNKDASGQSLNATAQLWQMEPLLPRDPDDWPTPRNCTAIAAAVNPDATFPNLETVTARLYPQDGEKRRLNPRFVAWLMGLPPGWLDAQSSCGPAEMASYRSRLRTRLACLLGDSALTSAAD